MTANTEKQLVQYREKTNEALTAAQSLEVSDYEGVMDAADFLYKVKSIADQITERKEAITRPLNEGLKSARKLFKEIEQNYLAAEKIAKDKILDWHYQEWKKGNQTDNKIAGHDGNVVVVERFVVEITDEESIPRDLCSPDKEKIEHHLRAGHKLKGAKLVQHYSLTAGRN
jgi:hypothetical protein